MTVTIPDSPGIAAAGNVKTYWVEAIADVSAPTVDEILAGAEITCAIDNLDVTLDQPTTTRTKRCYRQPVETPGRPVRTVGQITYDYDPQNPESTDYAYETLTPKKRGYIVDRLGLPKEDAVEVGDFVRVIPAELGEREDVSIDPTSTDAQTLKVSQFVFVTGEMLRDVEVVASPGGGGGGGGGGDD